MERLLQYCMQAISDFLFVDACRICRRVRRVRSRDRSGGPPSPTDCLARTTTVDLFWIFPVENRPFCDRCLRGLEIARETGRIGSYRRSGTVITTGGQVFAPSKERTMDGDGEGDYRVIAPFMINDISLKIIHLIKFSGHRSLVPLVAGAISAAIRTHDCDGYVLTAVPMDRKSEKRRGFNQAAAVAEELSKLTGMPFFADALQKVVRTPRQSQTDRGLRARNIRGAFTCQSERVRAKNVYLVDDLVTTGSTAAACASVLLAAEARSVASICFARAM